MQHESRESVKVKEHTGIIYQSLSGFYYVWADGREFVTRAKGLFRHQKIKPIVGDRVIIEEDMDDPHSNSRLIHLLPRKNSLLRPPVANVDYAVLVMSLVKPDFNYALLDQYLINIEWQEIKPIILLTKYDLLIDKVGQDQADKLVAEIKSVYQPIGYPVWLKEAKESFVNQVKKDLGKGIYVIMGQSGAGKSSFLNQLLPDVNISTAEISLSLNRGRHTTRKVTLYPIDEALLADTPGFSSIDLPLMKPEDLQVTYPEIRKFGQNCKYRTCLHDQEPACKVKEAVEAGIIKQTRYQTYLSFLEKLRQSKTIY